MSYSPPSQVIARQLEYLEGKHILLAGKLEDTFAGELCNSAASVSIFTTNLAFANQMSKYSLITTQFSDCYHKRSNVDVVILYWPKVKAEAAFLLTMLMAALGKGTEIIVVGENLSGVRSISKMFAPYGKVTKFDTARRCSFYWGQCTKEPIPFKIDDWFKSYVMLLGKQRLTIRSLPGVFSYGELDVGSQLLLDTLPALKGNVLDFGCGAGVIGCAIKLLYPNIKITMVDISSLAVASATETLRFNNLNGDVFASDVYSAIKTKFNHIISNPPFHTGLKVHYTTTETFLKQTPSYLFKNGALTIVANSFLHYIFFIKGAFNHCDIPAKNNKFTIYHAIKKA
ncbi:16S rRNA (guanine(1207)-N(2))-methyltransferase RsmC [Candidatus Enterovibrio altilux]|uniref:Ribosomal RNA small subunit methyltransferase C n=1 Tax=Candidatus Enterovibrio altilux TaxID=1927128 RepID=A0A291BB67_9GAMM|nr:16S rRNA (guanine(1207)-N(2))-methyltransferase RsmC [Candidatus Enterovibrio luxaltus]ATF10221.1 Ribosomal RNA small subunit methyltransferase C [Candidatus Enterovibrio luxaltus]